MRFYVPLSVWLVIFAGLVAIFVAIEAHAQPADVPAIAQDEIARRGNHVEQTGTIRSGLIAAALAPPADDSAKWFLTLVLKPGDPSSEKMRSIIANDPAMRPWVDVREPLKSTLHYQVRSIDDATQADWLKGLRPAIQRSGLPLVVLQPPKNGQFGPTATIVKMVAGVVSGSDLASKLREGIIAYVQAIESPGISQASIGVPPPFSAPPKEPPQPVQPQVPFEWPPVAVPVAPPPTPETPPNPTVPASTFPESWLAIVMAIGMYAAGWVSARMKTLAGTKLADITRAVDALKTAAVLKGPPPPPA